jgi:hypothetical protein
LNTNSGAFADLDGGGYFAQDTRSISACCDDPAGPCAARRGFAAGVLPRATCSHRRLKASSCEYPFSLGWAIASCVTRQIKASGARSSPGFRTKFAASLRSAALCQPEKCRWRLNFSGRKVGSGITRKLKSARHRRLREIHPRLKFHSCDAFFALHTNVFLLW